MCGIAGFVGDFVPGLLARMNAVQAHRGPDGQGIFEAPEEEISLGHVRLAILDLSDDAAQPMHSDDGRYVLSFNGEIYNYRDLGDQLRSRGCLLRSTGDTEVLLRGLQLDGPAFLEQLNGMFAFALWDRRERELILGRDALGIKPVYYCEPKPGTVLFASEIKTLCAHPGVDRRPDFGALHQHLAFNHSTGQRTALEGVRRLPPGHLLKWKVSTRRPEIIRYFRPDFEKEAGLGYEDHVENLRAAVETSVRRQMVSDVRVGSFLSGGLDSSIITSIAAAQSPHIDCFTSTYASDDNQVDRAAEDIPFARELAGELDSPLHEISMTAAVTDLWPRLVYQLDEPLADPAAIPCYLICQRAREAGVTVLLSGQGADEIFAGYPRYWVGASTAWLDRLPLTARRGMAAMARRLPGAMPGALGAAARRVRRVLSVADHDPAQRFLDYCTATPESEIRSILSNGFLDQIGERAATADCRERLQRSQAQGIDRYLERDQQVYLPNHNLLYTDKMSMAVGIEARVPLLDDEIVNLANRLPQTAKLRGVETKAALRAAARSIVPSSIIKRQKAGFGVPYRTWLRRDLAEMWNDLTSESAVRSRGWFDYDGLKAARSRSQTGQADLYTLQWTVLTFELWARQFLDANPAAQIDASTAQAA